VTAALRKPARTSPHNAPGRPRSAAQLAEWADSPTALGISGQTLPPLQIGTFSPDQSHHRHQDRLRLRDDAREAWRVAGSLDRDAPDAHKSQRLCGLAVIGGTGAIEVRRRTDRAGGDVVGTMSCSSANAVCPVCTARRREKRREEITPMMLRGQAEGVVFVMSTGTLKHTRATRPAQQRAAIEAGRRAIGSGRAAQRDRASGLIGSVHGIEFMLEGPAGPHGHIHSIHAFEPGTAPEVVERVMRGMGGRWQDWTQRNMDGLRPSDSHGWTWELARDADDVAKYVVKLVDGESWDITHEVTRGDTKRGRGGSKSPLELLAYAVELFNTTGDIGPMLRMSEYANAVRGMRSITIGKHFRDRLAPPDPDELESTDDEWETVGMIPVALWNPLVRMVGVAGIIDAGVRGGTDGVSRLIERAKERLAERMQSVSDLPIQCVSRH
jgi:hypothetical protein